MDWISWPVFLWFAGVVLHAWTRRDKPARRRDRRRRSSPQLSDDNFPLTAVGKIILMGTLFALFSAMVSTQPIWAHSVADLRYYVGALPLLLAMKGLFVEWVWRKHVVAGAAVLCVLLFSSIGAAPFNLKNELTGKATLGMHLFQFVREIHRPYRDSMGVVSDYLLQNAEKDDLVYVPRYADRDVLIFYTGDHVQFCCFLDENAPLPRKKIAALQAPLYLKENTPDWIIGIGGLVKGTEEQFAARYEVVANLDVFHYPTQRPELNFHAFSPLDAGRSRVFIWRRVDE